VLYNGIFCPLHVAFDLDISAAHQIIYRVVDLVFIADVFLNFNNGFYDKNSVLVMDHARIARRYINTWFVVRIHIASIDTKLYRWSWSNNELVNLQVDVISSVPVEMMYSNEDMDKAGFMRLNKVRNDNCAPVAQPELSRFGVSTSLISGGLSLNNYTVPSQLLRLFKLAKMFTVIRLGRIHRVFNRWEILPQLKYAVIDVTLHVVSKFCMSYEWTFRFLSTGFIEFDVESTINVTKLVLYFFQLACVMWAHWFACAFFLCAKIDGLQQHAWYGRQLSGRFKYFTMFRLHVLHIGSNRRKKTEFGLGNSSRIRTQSIF